MLLGCGGLVVLVVLIIIIAAIGAAAGGGGSAASGGGNTKSSGGSASKNPPKAAQAPHVLYSFSGSDIKNSPPFAVGSGPVTVKYSYDCSHSGMGSQGNFQADMVSGSQSDVMNYDDLSIANKLGKGGSDATTVYPANPGKQYHFEINSECSWSVQAIGK